MQSVYPISKLVELFGYWGWKDEGLACLLCGTVRAGRTV